MTSFRVRPRFQQVSVSSINEIQEKVRQHLNQPEADCVGRIIPGHIVLTVPEEDLHFWSPRLSLSLEEDEEGTLIRGLYGPAPSIWLMFAFGYGLLSFLIMVIGIIGFSRLSLGLSAPILWVLPFLVGGLILLYIVAQVGQKIGVEQTFTLHHFFEEAIDEKIHIH